MKAVCNQITQHNHRSMLVLKALLPLRWGIWGETERDWEFGALGHAGHLTGCGGQLWRERWLNGSDVGRLQGTRERWATSRPGS